MHGECELKKLDVTEVQGLHDGVSLFKAFKLVLEWVKLLKKTLPYKAVFMLAVFSLNTHSSVVWSSMFDAKIF